MSNRIESSRARFNLKKSTKQGHMLNRNIVVVTERERVNDL